MSFLSHFFHSVREQRLSSQPSWKFDDLETTPYLYSSDYLFELYNGADTDEKKEDIYGYIQDKHIDDPQYKRYFQLARILEKDLKRPKEEQR
jgi:hypothetical protein